MMSPHTAPRDKQPQEEPIRSFKAFRRLQRFYDFLQKIPASIKKRGWLSLPIRQSAESAGTRQNVRAGLRRIAFARVTAMYGGEPRWARRNMARAIAKNLWRDPEARAAAAF
jgi:hypothetical protein